MTWTNLAGDLALDETVEQVRALLDEVIDSDTNRLTVADADALAKLEAARALLAGTLTVADAAEERGLLYAPIDFATAAAHQIVAVPAGSRLRLRRFLLTSGDPDADPPANPVLTFTLGGQTLRTTALIGRFDILGDDGEDLVITSSKAGQVDGTVGYLLEAS